MNCDHHFVRADRLVAAIAATPLQGVPVPRLRVLAQGYDLDDGRYHRVSFRGVTGFW